MTFIHQTFRFVWGLSLLCFAGCSDHQAKPVAASKPQTLQKASSSKNEKARKKSDPAGKKKKHTNRLTRETSPYLLLHAHNPVDWYPWGPEAFEKAKKENKPIFLSIGYSSCYWCHVMERKVFTDEEIARYMNQHFVNIKVDREERPDVDDIYMTSLQIYFQLSGSHQGGGWPLSMFLTPEGKPIAGGTYLPPKDEDGRLGFPTVMKRVVELWTKQQKVVQQNAEVITSHVQRAMKPKLVLQPAKLERKLAASVAQSIENTHDSQYGGVDFNANNPQAPKFPVPTKLALLQYEHRKHDNALAGKIVHHTLDRIAAGGIYDHLAGGFHRYSTDRAWMVPHFEKMLYDNAQLADVYVEAFRQTKKPLYREVAENIFAYVLSDMTDPQGGFYSALDAETDAIEGKYYVWSKEEVDKILSGQDGELFKRVYGFNEQKYFEHGYVLHLPKTIEEVAKELTISPDDLKQRLTGLRQKMLAARANRKAPLKDDKLLTSWNGLMIRALANGGSVFDRKDYVKAAEKAAAFILNNMRDDKSRLLRTYRAKTAKLNAYLDDYAFLIEGVLALHRATGDKKWLDRARRLTDDQIQLFWDKNGGGFFFTSHHHEELLARTKNAYDAVLPAGNSVSVRNLVRLASLTNEKKYRQHALETLELFAHRLKDTPSGMANMAQAMHEFLDMTQTGPGKKKTSRAAPGQSGIVAISAKTPAKQEASDPLVTANAYLSVDKLPPGGRCQIVLVLDIKDGWHINANPAKPQGMVPTKVSVNSKHGIKLTGIRYPAGKKFSLKGFAEPLQVYEKQVAIRGVVEAPASAADKIDDCEFQIRYQACNAVKCELPKTLTLNARIPVAGLRDRVKLINQRLFEAPKTE